MSAKYFHESRLQRVRRKTIGRVFYLASLSVGLIAALVLLSTVIQLFSDVEKMQRDILSIPNWLSWSSISIVALFFAVIAGYYRHPKGRVAMTIAAILVIADSAFFVAGNMTQRPLAATVIQHEDQRGGVEKSKSNPDSEELVIKTIKFDTD